MDPASKMGDIRLIVNNPMQRSRAIKKNAKSNKGKSVKPSAQISSMSRNSEDAMKSIRDMVINLDKSGYEKHVQAADITLATYHRSTLYGQVSSTIKVRAALRAGKIGYAQAVVEFVLALLSAVLYIRSTYTPWNPVSTRILEVVTSAYFVVDYLLKVYSAPFRASYIFSRAGIVDLLSALPAIYMFQGGQSSVRDSGSFIQILRFLRILRLFTVIRRLGVIGSTIRQQMIVLIMYTFGIVFVMAGFFQYVERRSAKVDCDLPGFQEGPCIDFYGAFYFMTVTILTVGNASTVPTSEMGRLVVLATILIALLILPVQLTRIADLASRSPYGGKYSAKTVVGDRFVILTGSINIETVRNYLAEFYSPVPEEELAAFPLRVIVMAPFKPSFELKTMLTQYGDLVRFIEGSPLKHSDLSRVNANEATTVYILADKFSQNYAVEDAGQIAGALSVNQFCEEKVRVITELLSPESLLSSAWEDLPQSIETICPQQLRFQLLARSCYVKGLSTLVSNLFVSALSFNTPAEGSWLQEYCHGLEQEVYPVLLPPVFVNKTFKEVAEFVYIEFKVLLIGIDDAAYPKIRSKNQKEGDEDPTVFMFPKNRRIKERDVGIIIAESLSAVQAISVFGAPKGMSCPFFGPKPHDLIEEERELWDSTKESWEVLDDMSGLGYIELYSALSTSGRRKRGLLPQPQLADLTEKILAWPPALLSGKPRLPVIAAHEDIISADLMARTKSTIRAQKHILVVCEGQWPKNLYYFLDHLRTEGFPTPPIVILSPNEPAPEQWGCVGIFEDVTYIKGTGKSMIDLVRAGLASVQHVIIVTEDLSESKGDRVEDDDTSFSNNMYANDLTNTIVVSVADKILTQINRQGNVTAELRYNPTFRYVKPLEKIDSLTERKMLNKRNRDGLYLFLPCYAEGKAFAPNMLDYILSSSFTNKNTVPIIDCFISGKLPQGSEMDPVIFDLIDVPDQYDLMSYIDVFRRLLCEKSMLAVGLYRHRSKPSLTPYVFTNPPHNVIVSSQDRIYVFRSKNDHKTVV